MKIHEKSLLGHRCYGFNLYRQLQEIDIPEFCSIRPEKKRIVNEDMNKALFDIVFSVNPLTLLPDGDIAVYMSENTSPDIRRFIEMNLHSPILIDADKDAAFAGLSDDDVATFMREPTESLSAYRQRMFDVIRQNSQLNSSME